jgi:hypothetical protein
MFKKVIPFSIKNQFILAGRKDSMMDIRTKFQVMRYIRSNPELYNDWINGLIGPYAYNETKKEILKLYNSADCTSLIMGNELMDLCKLPLNEFRNEIKSILHIKLSDSKG